MRQQRKDPGQRGKYAEKKVRELLQELSDAHADFDYERKYDARSAGGRFPSQVADFGYFRPDVHGVVEVKEIEHDCRLPKDKLPQIPRLKKRAMAGAAVIVLVFHTQIRRWRLVPFTWLINRKDQPSWDLTEFPAYEHLNEIASLHLALVGLRALKK